MWRRLAFAFMVVLGVGQGDATAQDERPTIPAILESARKSVGGRRLIPSGLPPTIGEIVKEADLIVRGAVGTPRPGYLSDDQRAVYTDYPLLDQDVLYHSSRAELTRSGSVPPISVTLLGGTVVIKNLTYSFTVEGLPSLEPGTTGLFLLKRSGNKYYVAGQIYGAFRIADNRLEPLTAHEGFAPELREISAAEAAARMVSERSLVGR